MTDVPVPRRIACWLLDAAAAAGTDIDIPVTHKAIAETLGKSCGHMLRRLPVHSMRGKVTIRDRAAVQAQAEERAEA